MIVVDFQHAKILFSNQSPKSKTLVVIPILNEGNRILNQLSRMQGLDMQFDIAIVDGNSKDGSVEEIVEKNLGNVIVIIKDSSKLGSQGSCKSVWRSGLKIVINTSSPWMAITKTIQMEYQRL
jgi:hypothetical protein